MDAKNAGLGSQEKKKADKFLVPFWTSLALTSSFTLLMLVISFLMLAQSRNYLIPSARVTAIIGTPSVLSHSTIAPLKQNDTLSFLEIDEIQVPKGSQLTLTCWDRTLEQFTGPTNVPMSQYVPQKQSRFMEETRNARQMITHSIIFVLVAWAFFLLFLWVCSMKKQPPTPAYLFTAGSLLAFFMLRVVFTVLDNSFLVSNLIISYAVFPLFFILSLFLIPVKTASMELEEKETQITDLLYDGLMDFDKKNYLQALKKFKEAESLAPGRPDIRNLVNMMDLKVHDPEEMDRIVLKARKTRGIFQKEFIEIMSEQQMSEKKGLKPKE